MDSFRGDPRLSSAADTPETPSASGGVRVPLALLAVTLLLLGGLGLLKWRQTLVGPQAAGGDPQANRQAVFASAAAPTPAPEGPTVGLTIDFGNGVRLEFAALPWFEQMTVQDALEAAATTRPGVSYVHRGEGAMAFLESLAGIGNQGFDARNWLYRVDDRPGEVSFGVAELEPGMRVLWIFAEGE